MRVLNKHRDTIPPDAVYVGRPTKWGNPMTVDELATLFPADTREELHSTAVDWYRAYINYNKALASQLCELKGKDLVCWCTPLPCHADVLLELANKEDK
jgi:hypothetical protein